MIRRHKPGRLTIREYISSVVERMSDPSFYWRMRYYGQLQEMVQLRARIKEFNDHYCTERSVKRRKKEKQPRNKNVSTGILNEGFPERPLTNDEQKVESLAAMLASGEELDKENILEASRVLFQFMKLNKIKDIQLLYKAFAALKCSFETLIYRQLYCCAKELFTFTMQWFYTEIDDLSRKGAADYCYDTLMAFANANYELRYYSSTEICKFLVEKRQELESIAVKSRERKKHQFLNAYSYYVIILKSLNNTINAEKIGYLIEKAQLSLAKEGLERALLFPHDEFTRVGNHLCTISWGLLRGT